MANKDNRYLKTYTLEIKVPASTKLTETSANILKCL